MHLPQTRGDAGFPKLGWEKHSGLLSVKALTFFGGEWGRQIFHHGFTAQMAATARAGSAPCPTWAQGPED